MAPSATGAQSLTLAASKVIPVMCFVICLNKFVRMGRNSVGLMSNSQMKCPVCFDGTVSRELWDMLHGKNIGLHNCGHSVERTIDLKIWIGKQLDDICFHGCQSCWSDGGKCSCKEEKEQMKLNFLTELACKIREMK